MARTSCNILTLFQLTREVFPKDLLKCIYIINIILIYIITLNGLKYKRDSVVKLLFVTKTLALEIFEQM